MWEYNYGPNSPNLDEELMHYGVIGMKWGKRRATNASTMTSKSTSGKLSRKEKKVMRKSYRHDYAKAHAAASRKVGSKLDSKIEKLSLTDELGAIKLSEKRDQMVNNEVRVEIGKKYSDHIIKQLGTFYWYAE